MKHTIAEMVKNNFARFSHYRQGLAYYKLTVCEKHMFFVYTFPVSLDDIGGATLCATEKALLMMRYIRKANEENTLTCSEQDYDE